MNKISLIVVLCLMTGTLLFAGLGQQFASLGDFELENGQVIKECRIGYRTFGSMNENKSNVVLWPTWFAGQSSHISGLIGPDKMVDSTKYFVIVADAIGNGISTSPSNSKLQPNAQFPELTIHDMVESQYQLLTRHLRIDKIYAVVGGSMGGMQTFDWIVSHPDFMEKAVPYVGSPRLTFYDLYLMQTQLTLFKMGFTKGCDPDSLLAAVSSIQNMSGRTPGYYVEHNKREDFPEFFSQRFENVSKVFTAYNYAAQLGAMISLDISKPFNGNMEEAVEHVKANCFIIVSKTDHIVNPKPAIDFAHMLGAKLLILENDCGHLAPGCEMERFAKAIREFLNN
jgi:homoserine O-acetyltransferase